MTIHVIQEILSGILLLALHLDRQSNFPKPLSQKEEKECFERMKAGDKKARDELIEHNLRLVAHIAKKYQSDKTDQEDLISIGTIGLIKAVETYSPDKGIRFATYGARCIQNEVLMYYRSLKKSGNECSINDPIETDKDGNPLTLMELLADEEDLSEMVDQKLRAEQLNRLVVQRLSPRERLIVTLRYGLGGGIPKTQREIAKQLGISRSYISRIEKKSLEKLRVEMEKGNA